MSAVLGFSAATMRVKASVAPAVARQTAESVAGQILPDAVRKTAENVTKQAVPAAVTQTADSVARQVIPEVAKQTAESVVGTSAVSTARSIAEKTASSVAVSVAKNVVDGFGEGTAALDSGAMTLGTVIAQYCGLLYGLLVCRFKYWRSVFSLLRRSDFAGLLHDGSLGRFFRMNLDLLGRSFFFILIYIGFTMIAAGYGDVMLAASSILMQLLMFFSYFTDGFAYAGEALTGRFIGARDGVMLRQSVRYVFVWSMVLAVFFAALYTVVGSPVVRLLTSDETVVQACRLFLPWLLLMPPLGCAAFTWDGIFLGATASRGLMTSMVGAAAAFFAVWYTGRWLLQPAGATAIHLLFAAYFAHLAFRTLWLTLRYRKEVLGSL